jgi:hypothetical protein
VAGLAIVYLLIPGEIKISSIAVIKANEHAVFRSLINQENWQKWWPSTNPSMVENNKEKFQFQGYNYQIGAKQLDGIEVIMSDKNDSTSTAISPSALSTDSMLVRWTATVTTSANPVKRIGEYFKAKGIRQNMDQLLAGFKSFAEKKENLYGINIVQTKVTDTILMVIKKVQKEKPSTNEAYSYINDIKKYIAVSGAAETNYPMLNIRFLEDKKSYELMVAIPVNKHLEGNDRITWKRMIPGNILFAEVEGGEATVEHGIRQMENYVSDNQRVSPALQYQLLVTDRMKEKDTAKWITRIYYPVL